MSKTVITQVKRKNSEFKNIEFEELQKVLFSLLSECWTWDSHEGFEKCFPQHDFENALCDYHITITF